MDNFIVQILSRKLIKPSNPTPQLIRNFKLSIFDQLAEAEYISIVLYYAAGNDEHNMVTTTAERRAQLEKSLSKALTQFYPLAGTLVQDDNLIDCSDQGVEYLETQVKGNLAEFLGKGLKVELLKLFVPWDIYLCSLESFIW